MRVRTTMSRRVLPKARRTIGTIQRTSIPPLTSVTRTGGGGIVTAPGLATVVDDDQPPFAFAAIAMTSEPNITRSVVSARLGSLARFV